MFDCSWRKVVFGCDLQKHRHQVAAVSLSQVKDVPDSVLVPDLDDLADTGNQNCSNHCQTHTSNTDVPHIQCGILEALCAAILEMASISQYSIMTATNMVSSHSMPLTAAD